MIATTATPTGALGALAALGAAPADTDTRATAADAAVQFAALLAAAQRPMGPRGPRVALADLADAGLLPQELAQELGTMDGEALVEEHPSAPAAFVPMGGAPVIDLSQFPHEHIATFAADDAEATDALDAVADEAREDEDAEAATTAAADPHGPTARSARATAMPAVTDRSTTALDGEFAARLTRVIDRMEAAGHEVEILETTRSSARQDALYAQGRTTEGPVVTWTRDSRHLTGHAADLRVDGKSSGPGYELLQRLAAAEGLRTLGAKDPGHIELPRTTVDAKEGATARRGTDPAAATAPAAPAAVSRLSRLSTLSATSALSSTEGPRTARTTIQAGAQTTAAGATPAPATLPADATARATTTGAAARLEYAAGSTVANATRGARGPIARTASPEMRARGVAAALRLVTDSLTEDGTIAPAAARAATTGTADAPAEATVPSEDPQVLPFRERGARAATTGTAEPAAERGARPSRVRRAAEAASALVAETRATALESMRSGEHGEPGALGTMLRASVVRGASTGAPVTPAGSLAAERVAALLAARDAAPAPTVGELRLAMDPARDGLSEVRLAVEGAALDATLRTSDAGIARGLQGEIAGLARALERTGFESARVQVALDAAQQARTQANDSVAAAAATARERGLTGGRDDRQGSTGGNRDGNTGTDAQREQQHQRRFGRRGT